MKADEVKRVWVHLNDSTRFTGEMEEFQIANYGLRDLLSSLKEENRKLHQERDSLAFALQIVSRESISQAIQISLKMEQLIQERCQ